MAREQQEPEDTVGMLENGDEAVEINDTTDMTATASDSDGKVESVLRDPIAGSRDVMTPSLHADLHDKNRRTETADADAGANEAILMDPIEGDRNTMTSSLRNAWNMFGEYTYKQDLKTQSLDNNARAKEIWDNSAIYDPRTELLFPHLQVFTACLASFAHGANDVANAIVAAVSAILNIYKTGEFDSSAPPVRKWVLVLGGAAISLGFILFGSAPLVSSSPLSRANSSQHHAVLGRCHSRCWYCQCWFQAGAVVVFSQRHVRMGRCLSHFLHFFGWTIFVRCLFARFALRASQVWSV